MILFLSITGIFLSVILIFFNARRLSSAVYLGIFFLGVSIYVLNQYILVYSKSNTAVSIILLIVPFSGSLIYLTGPMFYWYVRSVLTDNYHLRKADAWHLLPMVLYFIAALPDLFGSWSEKIEAATAIVNDAKAIGFYKPTLLSRVFSYPFMFISRPALILGYTCWATILFIRYLIRKKETKTFTRQYFMITWLSVLLFSLLVLVISHILLTIEFTGAGSKVVFALTTLKALSLAGLSILLLSPFFFPEVLYGLPQIPLAKNPDRPLTEELQQQEGSEKATTHFEASYLTKIHDKATLCMQEFRPYLQPDFNMAQLSVLMHVPVHHLAYYFREEKKQTFSDFRNEWRVEHAKNLMKEGKSANLTLEAIGILSGFSSRNTFLHAFKKEEGISPHAFLAQIREK